MKFIEQACALFLEHGSPDSAALSYEKGAKFVFFSTSFVNSDVRFWYFFKIFFII